LSRFTLAGMRRNRLPPDVADDILQEVRRRLSRALSLRRLAPGVTLRSWTRFVRRTTQRCVYNACRETFRWQRRHRTGGEATRRLGEATNEDRLVPHARHPWCGPDDPAEAAVRSEELARLQAATARLGPEEQVMMQVLDGRLMPDEAAQQCSVSVGTIYRRRKELMAELRVELSEEPGRPATRRPG
jgi:RNA polymerase sigma factor (sigma-70 family)